MNLLDKDLEKAFREDKKFLEKTQIPIVTISASYKEDVKGTHGLPENEFIPDVVLSRAHYSMALGAAITAWKNKMDYHQAWIVDPTNYVSSQDWQNIKVTEAIGKTIARHHILQAVKAVIDRFGRKKLPILSSITPPLLYLFRHVQKPILSFHIAAGNCLVSHGKTVIQVVTDPHVREDYLVYAGRKNLTYCVFDERTKYELLEKASLLKKKIDPQQVIVTGPPVDPRIISTRGHKTAWRNGPLNLCLCTGGLGTNKYELRQILTQLLPELRKRPAPYRLLLYSATHQDIFEMAQRLAQEAHITCHHLNENSSPQLLKSGLSVIYHPQIVDANETLVKFAFPWADGFITKPSGDMAYDAAASGSFILTLKEWGEWEHNIKEVFEQKNVAREAQSDQIVTQLQSLTSSYHQSQSWVEQAMNHAFAIDKLFLSGTKNILKVVNQTTT